MSRLCLIQHPLIQHKLSRMRDVRTPSAEFRRLLREISVLMAYELTRDLPVDAVEIQTPLETMPGHSLDERRVVLASVLRAGNGLLDGLLEVLPGATVGHIGLYRDPQTLQAVEYYLKVPDDLSQRTVMVLDPMLATGHSAVAALDRLVQRGARDIRLLCLVACPEGLAHVAAHHPEVTVYTPAVDRGLNAKGYIVPGLGDAGDRLFATD